VEIGTDYTDSCKSKYHAITTTTVPKPDLDVSENETKSQHGVKRNTTPQTLLFPKSNRKIGEIRVK
jgi:hypothetical protein